MMSVMFFNNFLIILVFITLINSYEIHQYSRRNFDEYDRDELMNSIFQKYESNKFVPKFQLKQIKNRFDIKLNDGASNKLFQNDFNKLNNENVVHQQQDQQQSESAFSQNVIKTPNKIIVPKKNSSDPLIKNLIFNNSTGNPKQQNLPIYFTNPLTGIVYAITEVGNNNSMPSSSSSSPSITNKTNKDNRKNSIPIYIPKEQYDRDMNLLKLEYMKKCNNKIHKNHIKPQLITKKIQPTTEPIKTTIKPIATIIKNKKPNKLKSSIESNEDDDDDDYASTSGSYENVFNQVYEAIEESSTSSSEEYQENIRKRKYTDNNKILKFKPLSIINKNENLTKTLNNRLINTQLERPTYEISKKEPVVQQTTMQSFPQLHPLRKPKYKSPTKPGSVFSSPPVNRIISKRSTESIKSTLASTISKERKHFTERNSLHDEYVSNIPIVKYTTPSFLVMPSSYNKKRIRKRSIKNKNLTSISIDDDLINSRLNYHEKSEMNTLKGIYKTSKENEIIPIKFSKKLTTLPRFHQTNPPDFLHHSEKDNGKKNIVSTQIHVTSEYNSGNNVEDTIENISIKNIVTTTPMLPTVSIKQPSDKIKESNRPYKDDYEDDEYFLSYSDLPFSDVEYANDDIDESKDDEEDNDDGDGDSDDIDGDDDDIDGDDGDDENDGVNNSENDDYSNEESNNSVKNKVNSNQVISEINITDPHRDHRTRKNIKKKFKRKRKQNYNNKQDDDDDNDDDDEDDDDDDNSESNIDVMEFFRIFFYPARMIFNRFLSNAYNYLGYPNRAGGSQSNNNNDDDNDDDDDGEDDDDDDDNYTGYSNKKKRKPKLPKYTVYNNKIQSNEDTSNSWFGNSWIFGGYDKEPSEEPGWFESWFDSSERSGVTPTTSSEDYEDGYWFQNLFDSSSSVRKKKSPTTSTLTPESASAPFLKIANPMKNPQKWIGILAQHIVNSTRKHDQSLTPEGSTPPNPLSEDDEPDFIDYNKYQIWRLKPFGDAQIKILSDYKDSEEGSNIQWLQGPTLRGFTDVLVPPKYQIDFQGTLNFEGIAHEVLIFDVGKAILYESRENTPTNNFREGFFWNRYHKYDRIIQHIESLQVRYPNLIQLFHIGRSYEGRPLIIVKISFNENSAAAAGKKKQKLNQKNNNRNNNVFIEAGVHGREWIAPASATWFINEIIKIMKNNRTTANTEYIKKTSWYIMPVLNPDGYEYSHEYDRMWRKSRSKHLYKPSGIINSAMTWFQQTNSEKICFGVDLDQNWEYDWNDQGSSKSQCNEFYSGPSLFSEPETRALSKFLMDNRKKIKLFISLQSYGQIISYPNRMNSSFSSDKLDDLLDVAMVGNDALRKSGSSSRYKIDSANDLVAIKSGSSTYFAMYEAGIPFSYTIYLGDNGVHGYLLPASNIESTARDAFEIIKAMIDYI